MCACMSAYEPMLNTEVQPVAGGDGRCRAGGGAGMQQRARLKALARFRSHDNAVLVASDVAARGLDIAVRPD